METIRLVYPVEGGDLIEAGEASSKMKLTLKKLGLPQDVIRRASICMYEGEINMVIHADGGQAEVEVDANQIVIRMTDTGPGIPDGSRPCRRATPLPGRPPGSWASALAWACPI